MPLSEPPRLECNRVRGYHTQDWSVPVSWSHHPVALHLTMERLLVCRRHPPGGVAYTRKVSIFSSCGYADEALTVRIVAFSFIVTSNDLAYRLYLRGEEIAMRRTVARLHGDSLDNIGNCAINKWEPIMKLAKSGTRLILSALEVRTKRVRWKVFFFFFFDEKLTQARLLFIPYRKRGAYSVQITHRAHSQIPVINDVYAKLPREIAN